MLARIKAHHFAIIMAIAVPNFAIAQSERPLPHATFEKVMAEIPSPSAWQDFCRRYSDECHPSSTSPSRVALNAETWLIISDINTWANHTIKPVTDLEHWGVVDRWDIPTDQKGDCEDFALLKRKTLHSLGLPQSSLLMTVVINEHDEGHAVLTVATDHGDLILDNVTDQIISWDQTHYYFVERQSMNDPNIWTRLATPQGEIIVASQADLLQRHKTASAINER
jgi:predicted transglutaminase-like cysteine proteinase